jgi:hypothetical protein
MGFFKDIFGGGNYTGGGNYQIPPPPSVQYTYQQLQAQALQLTQARAIQGGLMGSGMSGITEVYRIDQEIHKLTSYAEMCGDTVEKVDLPIGEETDDVKVAILKAADVGKYIKNVGIKINDERFAVYREQGE